MWIVAELHETDNSREVNEEEATQYKRTGSQDSVAVTGSFAVLLCKWIDRRYNGCVRSPVTK